MKRKVLTIVQIVIAAVVVAYFILPDLLIGLFDDAFFVILAVGAEIALTIVQIVSKSSNSRIKSKGTNYQQNYQNNTNSSNTNYQYNKQNNTYSNNANYQNYNQNNTYSNSTKYQNAYNGSNSTSNNQDNEFQFFAGCTNWEQVKSRYRELMKIYHPDVGKGGHEEATKRINAEYNMLKKKYGH